MKKNVLMRAASGLLVATMLTTCAISGTFAKYVTQDNGGDVARVAKWGVVVQVEGDLYGQKYLNDANTVTIANDTTVGVDGKQIAKPDNAVVAPGTKSDSPFTFGINGTPEVDSETTIEIDYQNIYLNTGKYGVMVPVADGVVTAANFADLADNGENNKGVDITATEENGLWVKEGAAYKRATAYAADTDYYTLEDYVDNAQIYYPVDYTLVGQTAYDLGDVDLDGPDNKEVNTLEEISKKILTQVGGAGATWTDVDGVKSAKSTIHVENNVDLAEQLKLKAETLTWEWEFHDNNNEVAVHDTETHHISQQDKLDTILGNLMAERVGGADFKGEVVKLNDGTGVADWAWAAPTEVATDAVNDFCLDTLFNICILVEQVD